MRKYYLYVIKLCTNHAKSLTTPLSPFHNTFSAYIAYSISMDGWTSMEIDCLANYFQISHWLRQDCVFQR